MVSVELTKCLGVVAFLSLRSVYKREFKMIGYFVFSLSYTLKNHLNENETEN